MASYQQYRAPRQNDRALVEPGWPELLARLAADSTAVARISFGGLSLWQLQAEARRGLVAAAVNYTSRYADPGADTVRRLEAGAPLILSGHQPDLFHPGVWFKNFALDSLAKAAGGIAIHLLIDSDLCRETSVRTPADSLGSPRVVAVAFDEPRAATPHEQRRLADADCFRSFPGRLAETVRPLVPEPLAPTLWRHLGDALGRDEPLGQVLSAGRHRLEREWGSQTLELPASVVADSEAFRRFAATLLVRGPQVAAAYNGALAEYRTAHKLRNAAQPMPDLTTDATDNASWCETPFWGWSEKDPVRRPLFVRHNAQGIELSNRTGWAASGPSTSDDLIAWLGELRSIGVKLRSRALVTTLYARLVLADLFLHGIGGAKYDQVTDRFAERLFGAPPRPHATLTATLRLPIEHDSPTEGERQRLAHRLHELRYHPEQFLPTEVAPEVQAAAERKAFWIGVTDPQRSGKRHAEITKANRRLYEALGDLPRQTRSELEATERGVRNRAILDSREYSFCLFPAADVRRRLTDLSRIGLDG